MKNRKIAIFSEDINGPRIARAAQELGITPYLFYLTEPNKKEICPIYKIDANLSTNILENEIESLIGKPDAAISCIEQTNVNIARYMENIGIGLNSIASYEILRDKARMKSLWLKEGISTPFACIARSFSELDLSLFNFPVIVKPTHGAASAGVRIIQNEEELKKQISKITRFNITTLNAEKVENPGFLIEEYIDGEEYSVDTVWFKGKPILNGIMSKGNPQGPTFPDRLYLTEPSLTKEIKKELLELSHKAVKSAGVISGATHTEIRMRNNRGYVIESALRPGAGGCFYDIFEKAFGVSFYKALVLVSLNKHTEKDIELIDKMNLNTCDATSRYFWYNMGYHGHGVIKNIEGQDKIINAKFIDELCIRKKVGDYLPAECDSYSYLGWITGNFTDENTFNNYYSYLQVMENYIKIIY